MSCFKLLQRLGYASVFNLSTLYPTRGCHFLGLVYEKLEQRDLGLWLIENLAPWAIFAAPCLASTLRCWLPSSMARGGRAQEGGG